MHVKQWLMIGTLTGAAVLAGGAVGVPAQAASGGGGGAQIDGTTIWTTISYSESGAGSGWHRAGGLNWTPPSCWLEPWPGGFGVSPGDTPNEFADFMTQLDGFASTQGNPGNPDGGAAQWDALYKAGQGDDPIVHMISPPYNEGQSGGLWYGIACSTDASYSDLANFVASLHRSSTYEDWFWIRNGNPPAGVPAITPTMLAEYAASKLTVPTDWPTAQPPLTAKQTVGLPTLLSSAADYRTYTVRATLADLGMTTQVTATPYSITVSSSNSAAVNPVTCRFNGTSLASSCALNFNQATPGAQRWPLQATMTWQVVWGGDKAYGEAGWTKMMTAPLGPQTVSVQEIQTIVDPATAPAAG